MPIIHLEDGVPPAKSKHILLNMSQTGSILAAGDELSTLTPPKGYIWEIVNMYLDVKNKTGSAAGTQDFEISAGLVPVMFGSIDFGSDLTWTYGEWGSVTTQKPADAVNAMMALNNIVVDADNALGVRYTNNLDVTQTWSRTIYFTVKQTPII